jgi:glycosyltransferase involved in cell wall biosynthesis
LEFSLRQGAPLMPTTLEQQPGIDITELVPGTDLSPRDQVWQVQAPHVRWSGACAFQPGWYEVCIGAKSFQRFDLRKRLELTFDPSPSDSNSRPVCREAFSWNRSFSERFMVQLTRPVSQIRLDVWHAEGELQLTDFRVAAVSKTATVMRAIREKLRLVFAYRCFGGALARGSKLLFQGEFSRFGSKLLKGLTDSRVMQLGIVQSAEADASWWRRHALPAEEAERIRQRVDAMSHPPSLTILMPIMPKQFESARLTAQSVKRQLYPHWHFHVAISGTHDLERDMERLFTSDPRFSLRRVSPTDGIGSAIGQCLSDIESDNVLLLPPGLELAEHALAHLAEYVQQNPGQSCVGLPIAKDFSLGLSPDAEPLRVWWTSCRSLPVDTPREITAKSIQDWVKPSVCQALEPILAYPIDDRPLLDRIKGGKAPIIKGKTLFLSADLRGIGGYDHVAYAMLKGLPTVGADLRLHPIAAIRGDLVPPSMLPPVSKRKHGDRQLVMGPPFLVPRFDLDKASAVYTMWETDQLDPRWVSHLSGAGLVIVPSQWQADCFRADGITSPIEVVPLGFDPLIYHPTNSEPSVCTFGTAGTLTAGGLRKNAQWVVDLFRKAFPTEKNVRLRIKITPGSPGVETYDDARIDVLRAVLPHAELADWYRSLSAYVNGSMGEGFGLHLIEAMACGRPVISAESTGLTAFFDSTVGYAVEFDAVPVHNEIYTTGNWSQPREASMIDAMQQVYRNQDEAKDRGMRSASRAKRFTWKAMGQQLAAVLKKHEFLD